MIFLAKTIPFILAFFILLFVAVFNVVVMQYFRRMAFLDLFQEDIMLVVFLNILVVYTLMMFLQRCY